MNLLNKTITFSFICLLSLLLLSFDARSASLIRSDGTAVITSQIDVSEYRKRAIEDALQNISLQTGIELNSFSLIENGKILMDQVQSVSTSNILEYKILSEKVEANNFHVTLEALIQDNKRHDDSDSKNCRKTRFQQVDLLVNVKLDTQDFPAWVNLDKNWITKQILENNFVPNLSIYKGLNELSESQKLYSLFDQGSEKKQKNNLYLIETELSFAKEIERTLVSKSTDLVMYIKTITSRDNVILDTDISDFSFNLSSNGLRLNPFSSNKKSWSIGKNLILEVINSELQERLDYLKCIKIDGKLSKVDGSLILNYGHLDGINKDDIFEVSVDGIEKLYFKVSEIDAYKTKLELISERKTYGIQNGQEVQLIGELQ